jgi:hypothetical protein
MTKRHNFSAFSKKNSETEIKIIYLKEVYLTAQKTIFINNCLFAKFVFLKKMKTTLPNLREFWSSLASTTRVVIALYLTKLTN